MARATDAEYGRLQDEVDAMFDRLALLDDSDARALGGLWAQEDQAARERGWRAAKAAISERGLEELLEDAREAVRAWASPTRSDYPGLQVELGMPAGHLHPRRAAAPAILDAVVATLAVDRLGADEYDALIRPWATVVEEAGDSTA